MAAPEDGAVLSAGDFLEPNQFEEPGEEAEQEEPVTHEVEVFSVNWLYVKVFMGCLFQEAPGFDRIFAIGISSAEITATCNGMNIPQCEHEEILFAVRRMSGAASTYLNTKRVPKKS